MALNLINVNSDKRIKQIEKIITYAKQILGVDVKFLGKEKFYGHSGGYTAPNGQRKAEVIIDNQYNGLTTIFILLHELGHHIDFLKRGYVHDEEVAYHYYPEKRNSGCPKKWRKYIVNTEYQAIIHARELATYLDLKLPIRSYLKDEIFNAISLRYVLEKGLTTRQDRRDIWKESVEISKRILKENDNKMPDINYLIVYFK